MGEAISSNKDEKVEERDVEFNSFASATTKSALIR